MHSPSRKQPTCEDYYSEGDDGDIPAAPSPPDVPRRRSPRPYASAAADNHPLPTTTTTAQPGPPGSDSGYSTRTATTHSNESAARSPVRQRRPSERVSRASSDSTARPSPASPLKTNPSAPLEPRLASSASPSRRGSLPSPTKPASSSSTSSTHRERYTDARTAARQPFRQDPSKMSRRPIMAPPLAPPLQPVYYTTTPVSPPFQQPVQPVYDYPPQYPPGAGPPLVRRRTLSTTTRPRPSSYHPGMLPEPFAPHVYAAPAALPSPYAGDLVYTHHPALAPPPPPPQPQPRAHYVTTTIAPPGAPPHAVLYETVARPQLRKINTDTYSRPRPASMYGPAMLTYTEHSPYESYDRSLPIITRSAGAHPPTSFRTYTTTPVTDDYRRMPPPALPASARPPSREYELDRSSRHQSRQHSRARSSSRDIQGAYDDSRPRDSRRESYDSFDAVETRPRTSRAESSRRPSSSSKTRRYRYDDGAEAIIESRTGHRTRYVLRETSTGNKIEEQTQSAQRYQEAQQRAAARQPREVKVVQATTDTGSRSRQASAGSAGNSTSNLPDKAADRRPSLSRSQAGSATTSLRESFRENASGSGSGSDYINTENLRLKLRSDNTWSLEGEVLVGAGSRKDREIRYIGASSVRSGATRSSRRDTAADSRETIEISKSRRSSQGPPRGTSRDG